MSLDSAIIDRIVSGVLTQLGSAAPRADGGSVRTESRSHATESRVHSRESRAVRLDARIVTAEIVDGIDSSATTVVVTPRAIVTPAAWDVAKLRGLSIDRRAPAAAPQQSPLSTLDSRLSSFLIIVHHTDAVGRLWDDLQGTWRREFLGCPDDAAKLAIAELSRGGVSRVVIVAEQTHRAACLANRHESVKAVAIRDAADVQAIKTQLRANVWCVSPRNKSWFELRRLFSSLDPRP